MISERHRFIFVHLNKTGGTSIEKVFAPDADQKDVHLKHTSAADYQQAFPELFRSYFKFAFVRNPWDWLVSRYFWSRDHQRLFDFSFHEMLWRLKNRVPLSDAAHWLEGEALLTQAERLSIDGKIAMDFVGRFENLQGDFSKVCSRLQIENRTLQHVFKTNHACYTEYYDDETRKIVDQLYAADIAAFGYRFGNSRFSLLQVTRKWVQRALHARPLKGPGVDIYLQTQTVPPNAAAAKPSGVRVERLAGNPIIRPAMLPGKDGNNINGPSLIQVPAWISNPLGRYYLYFAHHEGKYIRLAYADDLAGPWTVHAPGTLRIEDTACDDIRNPEAARNKHLASPDVHIDHEAREIRMYFHGSVLAAGPPEDKTSYQQLSLVATSKDGLRFEAHAERLGNAYFRVFEWQGAWYAVSMPGVFYRSPDGLHNFVAGPTLFTTDMRHSAVKVAGTKLQVFYSVVGENPERILLSTIDLTLPWAEWKASEPRIVLEPQTDWEGANLPAIPSVRGIARGRVRQLRDPAIFVDAGRTYLAYAVAGESGIAIAELGGYGE